MIHKEKKYVVGNKKSVEDYGVQPFKFKLHWDSNIKEYVLCRKYFGFGWEHFSIEVLEDMIKILKEESK